MKIIRFVNGRWQTWRKYAAKRKLLQQFGDQAPEIRREQWDGSIQDPTGFYLRCFHYFHTHLPESLRAHRNYFTHGGRGFGEDAFHVMWFLLFNEFQPESFLEIGVYRGQTLSLAALLAQQFHLNCFVQGISPFSSAGDSTSSYRPNVNYYEDTLKNFDRFGLSHPKLLRAYSTDPEVLQLIGSRLWDMIYIDGNHDYDVVRQDWEVCSRNLKPGGIIVIDDASLGTSFRPPGFASAGHLGPSQVVQEIDRSRFRELLHVGHNRVFQKIA